MNRLTESMNRFFEITDEAPHAHLVALHRTSEPQRGIAWMSKHLCDVRRVEVRRYLKLGVDGVVDSFVVDSYSYE